MKVLFVTSEWPSSQHPNQVPFIVQQARFLEKHGIEVSVYSFRGSRNILNYIRARLELRRKFNLKHFDIVHIHFGQSALIVLPVSVPTVVTFWGSDLHGIVDKSGNYTLSGKVLRTICKRIAAFCSEVIVVSNHMKFFLPRKCGSHTIPHGVDITLFKPMPKLCARRQLSLDSNRRYILFVSNEHRAVKRHTLAKNAVFLLRRKVDASLLTVTNVTHKEMPVYMNACDCLLLTSKHEGSPTVVKEAGQPHQNQLIINQLLHSQFQR